MLNAGIIAAIENAHAQAVGDDLLVRRSRLKQFVRQHVHLRVKSIAHDQAICAVEHAQTLRHVLYCGVKTLTLLGDVALAIEFGFGQQAGLVSLDYSVACGAESFLLFP